MGVIVYRHEEEIKRKATDIGGKEFAEWHLNCFPRKISTDASLAHSFREWNGKKFLNNHPKTK